jgi:hypothetical protein
VGLLFKEVVPKTAHPYAEFSQYGNWQLVLLPDWKILRPYQNLWDGAMGDKRGWYRHHYAWMPEYLRMWWWLAMRNPTNFHGRVTKAFNIRPCKTEHVAGKPRIDEDENLFGYSLLRAIDQVTGNKYYAFKLAIKVASNRYLLWKVGYKFELNDELYDFGKLATKVASSYNIVRQLCIQYAREGYRKGEAIKALDALVPATFRIIPSYKKIKD